MIPRILALVLVTLGVTFLFQNCGQRGYFPHEQAYAPITKLQQDMAEAYRGRLSVDSCRQQNYICEHEVFSAYATDHREEGQFPCVVLDGLQLCPTGELRTYDSSLLEPEEQEYQRYYCRYDLPNMDGAYPIQGDGEDLASAILGAYQTCLYVVGAE